MLIESFSLLSVVIFVNIITLLFPGLSYRCDDCICVYILVSLGIPSILLVILSDVITGCRWVCACIYHMFSLSSLSLDMISPYMRDSVCMNVSLACVKLSITSIWCVFAPPYGMLSVLYIYCLLIYVGMCLFILYLPCSHEVFHFIGQLVCIGMCSFMCVHISLVRHQSYIMWLLCVCPSVCVCVVSVSQLLHIQYVCVHL